MIRVFVLEQTQLVCEALSVVLSKTSDLSVVGSAQDAETAIELLADLSCDLLLANANLQDGSVLTILNEVRQSHPDLKTIVMGLPDTESIIMRYIEAGAVGYMLMDDSLDDLLARIRAAFNEEAIIDPEMAVALIDRLADLSDLLADVGVTPEHYDSLTERECEILELIANGLTNQEIADQLTIEVGTVKNHIHSIFDKLNLSNRKDAAIYLSLLQQSSATMEVDGMAAGDYPV